MPTECPLLVELTSNQTSLQNLHAQLSKNSKERAPIAPGSPNEQSEEHHRNSGETFQKAEIPQNTKPQEESRASKRLCLLVFPNASTDHDLFKMLVEKVSSILQSDSSETVADLCTSIQ